MRWLKYPGDWLYYQLHQFMIGGKEPGVLEVIGRLAPRPLLLIASGQQDIYFNRQFYQAANEPKELWELPDGEHGEAILSRLTCLYSTCNVSSSPGNCYRNRQVKLIQ